MFLQTLGNEVIESPKNVCQTPQSMGSRTKWPCRNVVAWRGTPQSAVEPVMEFRGFVAARTPRQIFLDARVNSASIDVVTGAVVTLLTVAPDSTFAVYVWPNYDVPRTWRITQSCKSFVAFDSEVYVGTRSVGDGTVCILVHSYEGRLLRTLWLPYRVGKVLVVDQAQSQLIVVTIEAVCLVDGRSGQVLRVLKFDGFSSLDGCCFVDPVVGVFVTLHVGYSSIYCADYVNQRCPQWLEVPRHCNETVVAVRRNFDYAVLSTLKFRGIPGLDAKLVRHNEHVVAVFNNQIVVC